MQFVELVGASREIANVSARTAKIERLAELLRRLQPGEVEAAIGLLSGEPRQGRIGLGGALLHRLASTPTAEHPSVSLLAVDDVLQRFATTQGRGSAGERERLLGSLFVALTLEEREFLARACTGGLRQGALEGIALEGLARASGRSNTELRLSLIHI